MLRFLRVTHLAVIDSVEVEFDSGLNVLTGETGAGKSILVEAVGLLLGSRAYVDGALTTAGALKELSTRLIELHGQHEHQTLLDPATHLGVLDTFGGLDGMTAPTAAAFDAMRALQGELARMRSAARDRAGRQDLMAFQLGEIDRAGLK